MNLQDEFIKDCNQFRCNVLGEMSKYGIPYETLNRIAIDCHDIADIETVLKDYNIANILEIGAYAGFSTLVFRFMYPEARILSVDPNFVSDADVPEEHRNGVHVRSVFDKYVMSHSIMGIERIDAYFSCLPQKDSIKFHGKYNSNIMNIPIIDSSILLVNGKFDLVFIDGDHYADSVYSDIIKAKTLLNSDGTIILHDMEGNWGREVKNGINKFLATDNMFKFVEYQNLGILESI